MKVRGLVHGLKWQMDRAVHLEGDSGGSYSKFFLFFSCSSKLIFFLRLLFDKIFQTKLLFLPRNRDIHLVVLHVKLKL